VRCSPTNDSLTCADNVHPQIYIEFAVKNPCYELGESIQLDMFKEKLDAYVRKLSYFRA
jgi:hypothetical protein